MHEWEGARGEEITSYKSHIASLSLTGWCIMILKINPWKSHLPVWSTNVWDEGANWFVTLCEERGITAAHPGHVLTRD